MIDRDFISEQLSKPDSFKRKDEGPDEKFYKKPRMVQHLDIGSLALVKRIYDELIVEDDPVILDQMASFDSHLPNRLKNKEITGLGMNEKEMKENSFLSDYVIHDLNEDPKHPFEDERFDAVINTVSVDYMTRPFDVFSDTARILKPGGVYIVVFSNRMFPQKVVNIWEEAHEEERIAIVDEYFAESEMFNEPNLYFSIGRRRPEEDKYSLVQFLSDPVFVMYSEKKGGKEPSRRPDLAKTMVVSQKRESVEKKKKEVKHTHRCPYCDSELIKWQVPQNPFFATWDSEYLYICFNDSCPYFMRGWDYTFANGNGMGSYRFMFDESNDACHPMPVYNDKTLKDGIITQG